MNTLVTTQNAQIKAIIGEVKLLKNNLTSELKVGSEIVAGDNLLLSENAQVTVQYSDGRIEVIFGSDGTQFVDEAQQQSIPEAIAVADEDALPDEIEDVINGVDDEISAIQSQIEGNGELDLPDTAAGTASAGGGISFSSLDRNNDETLANTAFQSEAFTPAQASIETPEIINQEIIIVSTLDAELTIDSLSQTAQITGSTTGVLPNSPVSITLTDSQGNQLTVNNVTISQDGSFNADNIDISTLSDGQISATVNVTDVNNQSVQDLSGDELDTTAPLAPTVTLNETNDDGFINLQEKDAGIDATVTLNDPNLNVGDVVEIVVTIGNNSTTSNIQVTQAIIDNPTISVSIDNTLLVDDAAVNVTATAIDDKGNRSNTGQDEAVVDINVPGGDKDQNNQSADAPTVSINEQVEDNVIDNTESSNLTARINLPQVGIEAGDSLIVTINGTEQPPITITQELIDNGFTNIVVPPSEITNGQNLQVTAKVTDPAGNSSSEGTDSALVDLSAPNSNLGPVTDIEEANNTVSENASIGDSTGVHADATDPDGDDVSYTLSDDADGRFTIDPTTGEITVAKELDFDNGDGGNHVVTVVATSTDGSTSTQNFTIDVTNADGTTPGQGDTDNPIGPVTDIDNTANTVSENAAIGDSTGVHADATDPDGDNVSYTLSDNAGGRFAIDATTGEITVAKELDFESGDNGEHSVTIVATSSDNSSSVKTITIEVTDQDINTITDEQGAIGGSVSENAEVGAQTGVTAQAIDPDTDNSNDDVTYALSNNADGRFAIDPTSGVVTVAKALDYENGDSGNHTITVVATAGDNTTTTQDFVIEVTDGNDAPSTSNSSVSATEDTYYYFTANDFDFADQDTGDALQSVILTELSSSGTFQVYSGGTWITLDPSVMASLGGTVSVLASQLVPDADGHTEFRFIASNNEASSTSDEEYANFKFKVSDGSLESEEATASIHVNAVADEPSVSVVPVTSVTANGLTRTVWNQIDIGDDGDGSDGNYGNGSGVNASTLVNAIDQLNVNAGTSSNTTIISDGSVTAGEANFVTGLVYLEAGKSYNVAMTGDDSYVIQLGNNFELSGTWGTKTNSTTSGTFTPTVSGYYTLDFYQHNQSGPGNYNLTITDASTGLTPQMFTDESVITNAGVRLSANLDGDGNGYYQPLTINEGDVNTDIPLSHIDASLSDTDGSESLALEVIGVPSGMVISDGTNSVTSTGAPIDISNWNTAKLTLNTNNVIVIDDSLDLSFKATATESSNSDTASQSTPITVDLLGVVNDAPEVNNATFNEQSNANEVTFNLGDYVTDREDDTTAARTTNIVIESLPSANAGTLVKVNEDGTTTPVTEGEVLPESTTLRYIENTSPVVDASFNAVTDFEPAHGTNAVSSFTSSTGIELTGGTFSGATPTSGLTAGTLNYDTSGGDTDGNAIGVNGGELEGSASSNEYISAKFTTADVTNVTLGLSSVGSHFSTDTGAVNAVVKVALFKDGVQVGEIQSFENLHNLASETNQPTITIDSSQEFDELRLFMTSTSSTSSMLLRTIDVNETASSDSFNFSAVDADGKASNETATVTFNMTPNAIDAVNDSASGVVSKFQQSGDAADILTLGQDGAGQINGDPGLEEQTRVIDLGIENAGKNVTLSFDAFIQGGWENDEHGHTADRFIIEANGNELDNRTYMSGAPGDPNYNNSNWSDTDNGLSYTFTLDSQGRANLKFSVASTMTTEVVDVTNIKVTLNEVELSTVLVDVLPNDETLESGVTITLPSSNVTFGSQVVGTLSLIGNKVLFTPNEALLSLTEAQLDQLSFDYTISDGTTSDTATVNLDLRIADATTSQTIGSSLNDMIVIQQGEFSAPDQTRLSFSYGGTDGKYTQQGSSVLTDAGNNRVGQSHSATSAQTIDARAGNDHVETASGNDIIFAGDSTSVLDADVEIAIGLHGLITGNLDSITQDNTELLQNNLVSNPQLDIVNSGSGDDIIYGQAGSDLLYGHTGNDYIDGGIGNDGLRGGLGNDTLLGQDGNDWLVGDDGNDTLIGGDGNDTIIAGLGDDIIIGGLGDDVMQSGQGSNTFLWLANELGTDTIENFNYGEDKIDLIDLLGLQSDQSLESYLSFNFDNGNTTISIDTNLDGNTNQDIVLSGTDLSSHDNQTIINTLFTKVDESEPLFSSNSVEETPPSLSDLDDDSVI